MPPVYFVLLLLFSIAAHFLFPLMDVIHFPVSWIGLPLVVIGALLNIWSSRLFKENSTTEIPTERPTSFVHEGPFRFTRNPMYLGGVLVLLGAAFLSGTVMTFLSPLVFLAVMQVMFIPREEENMKKAFGKRYLDYTKRVRRWV